MEEYKFYGHDNPFTKHDNGYFTQKYDPSATWWDEVLDGPNNASQALPDFKNSPEHYAALTDARENYIGVASVYYPESWNDYDNNGKLQTTSDTVILNGKTETVTTPVSGDGTCIVVGQLADKVGQVSHQPSNTPTAKPKTSYSPSVIGTAGYLSNGEPTCEAMVNTDVSLENQLYSTQMEMISVAEDSPGATTQVVHQAIDQFNSTLLSQYNEQQAGLAKYSCPTNILEKPTPMPYPY
jgi:hypothetical protein